MVDRLVIHVEGKLFIMLNVCTHIHSADKQLQLLVLLVCPNLQIHEELS